MNVIERIDSRVVNPAVIFGRRLRLQYAICTIKEHAAKREELIAEVNPTIWSTINGLMTQNNNLLAITTYEKNEKTVNQLSLLAMPSGVAALPAAQLSDLQSIADQCPLAGGEAVLKARALLTELAETPLFWLDDVTCGASNRPIGERSSSDETFVRCYPNPTSNVLNVEFSNIELSIEQYFVLDNLYGQEVLREKIVERKGQLNLPVSTLSEGIYFYFLDSSGYRIPSGQIVIQR